MDQKDELILRFLEKNANLSSRAIAENIGLPISTVHRRIRKLEKEKIIKGYRAIIEYEKTKRLIGAYVFINLSEVYPDNNHVPKSKIIKTLQRNKEVQELADVQGAHFDLILKCRFTSLKALSNFIETLRQQEGIEEIFSSIITDEIV
ncbi:MAG: Lrp/AsnC family transcriptional regulator [Candidatus Bathyarchaeota archaeon]|nr:Lrp/AsnC family transcriptional regulator [Candidatus Bathyarchaeum sp.]